MIHDVISCRKCPNWHSTTNYFTIANNICFYLIEFLRPTKSQTEARHHFIKKQQCAIFVTDFSQMQQEIIFWQDTSHISGNRLYNDGCNLPLVMTKQILNL